MSDIIERYLTRAEEKQLLTTIKTHSGDLAERDFFWIEALRCTGLRIKAFSMLTVGDAEQALSTRHLKPRPETQKRGAEQSILVTQRLDRALRALLRIRKRMGGVPGVDEPLVIGRRGERLGVRSYQKRLVYWADRAELPVTPSPHWLRHTLAMRVMETSTHSDPQLVAQQALNHRDRRTTEIYTRPSREQIAADLERASR